MTEDELMSFPDLIWIQLQAADFLLDLQDLVRLWIETDLTISFINSAV